MSRTKPSPASEKQAHMQEAAEAISMPVFNPQAIDVSANESLRRLKFTLIHGKEAMATRFPIHSFLYLKLRRAYEKERVEEFYAVLTDYVRQANGLVQGVVTPQEFQERLLPELLRVVGQCGLKRVSQYLLTI